MWKKLKFSQRYEKSEDGTKSQYYERYEKSKEGTKNPWYESSMVRKIHKWYETSMVRKVWHSFLDMYTAANLDDSWAT